MNKSHFTIFIDSSYNPDRKFGVGGFLCIPNCPDEVLVNKNALEELYSPDVVKTRIVEHTTNTRLELQTLLWALESLRLDTETKTSEEMGSITVYTDCRTAVDLLRRRERLGRTHYLSKRKGTILGNADIYKGIFTLCDQLSPKLVWIKGHTSEKDRVGIQKIFSEVDRFVRNLLRSYIARKFS
ncbi:MAG: hypothetical protein DWB56_12940 [Candidatus Jettenia sp.]|uniref:Ribonuclease H n=1 Tax=Candidatus Jettenia caeni TaxID=247490 RepID=I3IIL6_9BACT|nr:RNase H family protein [Candidatus Jettenia sp. AMX1]MBC6929842.1 hypothetical protein [Candidatus Jettenia sp.]NUN24056.1 hypothetical protein [Candidatus Jettenia caeni]KAA0248677.1 MAG: hypothetical protein EDM77_11630 [Candidatus Jettenia sp. AMX1]MCE7881990.1 hypothetical protein [Candidatus Jettenia sp. AMX1]MCQ3928067.1 hypothetical protein [Candidatus Jettenia sp.]